MDDLLQSRSYVSYEDMACMRIRLVLKYYVNVTASLIRMHTIRVIICIPWIVTVPGPYGPPAQPPHHTSKNGYQRPSFLSSLL